MSYEDFEDKYAGEERPDPAPKSDKERRRRQSQLIVRLSDAERSRMEKIRERTALSGASIVRRWISEQPLRDRSTDKLVGELRRQGGLLKHCAFGGVNRGAITQTESETMLSYAAELAAIARRIEQEYNHGNTDSEADSKD